MIKAQPVWLEGRENETNLTAVFTVNMEAKQDRTYRLAVTGSTLYRVWVNGKFAHYGPARAPHGYVRVDDLSLDGFFRPGENRVTLEVAGYCCKSYYTLFAPSFLCAEILEDGVPVAYTGGEGGFSGYECRRRRQKALRYSYQRTFTEIWIPGLEDVPHPLGKASFSGTYLEREVPYPQYRVWDKTTVLGRGRGVKNSGLGKKPDHKFFHPTDSLTAFPLEDIPDNPFLEIRKLDFIPAEPPGDPVLSAGEFLLVDMTLNNTGFILTDLTALEDSEVLLIFDEILTDGSVDASRGDCANVVKYVLNRHTSHSLQTFEVYTFRYLLVYVPSGRIRLDRVAMTEYSYPRYQNAALNCGDTDAMHIFRAALETYRQNTLDVFSDCPGRERAGWLCDSYFTAQSSRFFSEDGRVEKVMLENYLLPERFPDIPEGMLPMCYPADHYDGVFIPQWAMWYVVQLEDYLRRNADAEIGLFRNRCLGLLAYLEKFENEYGLLEGLKGWNFVEWSDANLWVQDVNYPTNMLYAWVLSLVGRWYGLPALEGKASLLRKTILVQSFDGQFFVDNAVRKGTRLEPTRNRSEICQYSAYFFGIAREEEPSFARLKQILTMEFGPDRKKQGRYQEVSHANAFIGNVMRMELLFRWGYEHQVLEEIKGYFLYMAQQTGTLWENIDTRASLNHGFASFAGVVLLKCLLGIRDIDDRAKTITFRFSHLSLNASGKVGDLEVSHMFRNGKRESRFRLPGGYTAILE